MNSIQMISIFLKAVELFQLHNLPNLHEMIKTLILDFDTCPEVISYDDLLKYKGKKQFNRVKSIETVANTSELTLSFLGPLFPNLEKLRLNNSLICSIRDIGCKFPKLKFLSVAQCNITSLDGIETISTNLQELYLAGNNIPDLVDLMSMDQLRIVDLEGNGISNFATVEILSLCQNLTSLTLRNNPISVDPNYRKKIFHILPNLRYLDETRFNENLNNNNSNPTEANINNEDNLVLSERNLSNFEDAKDVQVKSSNQSSTLKSEKCQEADVKSIIQRHPIEMPSASSTPHSPRKKGVNSNIPTPFKRSQSTSGNFIANHDSNQNHSVVPPSATPPPKTSSSSKQFPISPPRPLKEPIYARASILNARKVRSPIQTKTSNDEIMTDFVYDLVNNNPEININQKRLYERSVFPEVNVLFSSKKLKAKHHPGIIRPISGGR